MTPVRRAGWGLAIVGAGLAPLLLLWGAMLLILAAREADAPPPGRIPSPAKMPVYLLGPFDVVVYTDPWFAGTIRFWFAPWLGLVVLCGILGMIFVEPRRQGAPRPATGRSGTWLLAGLILGLVLAGPWVYGVFRLLSRPWG